MKFFNRFLLLTLFTAGVSLQANFLTDLGIGPASRPTIVIKAPERGFAAIGDWMVGGVNLVKKTVGFIQTTYLEHLEPFLSAHPRLTGALAITAALIAYEELRSKKIAAQNVERYAQEQYQHRCCNNANAVSAEEFEKVLKLRKEAFTPLWKIGTPRYWVGKLLSWYP